MFTLTSRRGDIFADQLLLDAGEMVHQVTLLQQVDSSDEGGPIVSTTPFATVYAKIDFTSATDVVRGGQTVTETLLTVSMWYLDGVLPSMQVQAQNGIYIIRGILNVLNMNVVLKLECLLLRSAGQPSTPGTAVFDSAIYDTNKFQ
jgi:hypothetical protein